MEMLKKFNLIAEELENELNANKEVSKVQGFQYDFKKDENGNIICTFIINQDQKKLTVVAHYFNKVLDFTVIDEDGQKQDLSEKEFAAKFWKDYDLFKETLEEYSEKGKLNPNDGQERDIKVKNKFDKVLEDTFKDNGIKYEKSFNVDGVNFVFRMLKDKAVQNYCSCFFQCSDSQDEEISSDSVHIFKALIALKEVNSVILKVIEFDGKGNLIDTYVTENFKTKYKELYSKLVDAIIKMQKYNTLVKNDF